MNSHVNPAPGVYAGMPVGAAGSSAGDYSAFGDVNIAMPQTVPTGVIVPYGIAPAAAHPVGTINDVLGGYAGVPMLPMINTTSHMSLVQFEREAAALANGLDNLQLNPRAKEFVPPSLQTLKGWPMFASPLPTMPGAAYGLHPDAGQVFSPTADNRNGKGTRGGKGRSSRGGSNGTSNGKKKTVQQGMETNVQRTVYICDIDQQVTEEQLANVFADCGAVIDCRVCGDPNSAMRFAFIEFTTKESAAKAISKTGTVLGQYPLRVLPSKTAIVPVNNEFLPRTAEEREQCSRTVYAANICRKVDRADVARFFQTLCGPVSKIRLLGDSHHNTRIAFVEFEKAESAKAALNCSGALLGSLPIRVSPSKTPVRAEPRDEQ